MTHGYLNFVLHAHLPFVRHIDRDDRLEERWLFEAITETYIPLLQVFHRLVEDEVDFRITISLSPTLISMLSDELLQTRYLHYLNTLTALTESEVQRTATEDVPFHGIALEYQRRVASVCSFFQHYKGNILTAFAELYELGKVELMTSSATHAFLPYLLTTEGIRAQISTAVSLFETHFGRKPAGLWLPECGYTERVNTLLHEFGIRYFFLDTHAVASASPAPLFATYAPILTPAGTAVFARDEASSQQVWSSVTGYPGDFDYREYYRDIGFDLPESYIHPFLHPEGIRVNTGLKYYRITGNGPDKQPYHFDSAREKAAMHAGDFLLHRERQVEHLHTAMGRKPIVTAPYDAELFGHWWYEGPLFLDVLFRKMYYDQHNIAPITPSEYLSLYPDFQSCHLQMSSWGRNGYGEVWLNGSNDWIYPALHDCEQRMRRMANAYPAPQVPVTVRTLNQAARELLLAQSSDWAFIMDAKTTVNYAVQRIKQHVHQFQILADMIETGVIDEFILAELEATDAIFPALDYQIYQTPGITKLRQPNIKEKKRILMLSWEFPPMSVGGLSRHVFDLSRALVDFECEIHVVTTAIGEYPLDEIIEGVHVHRVQVPQPDGGEFVHFAFQLNLAMMRRSKQLIDDEGLTFDVIHAHDWLVADVAKVLKHRYHIPLVATIHATEHGRNHGIYTDTQRHIHHLEWVLTYEAKQVIVCSSYMKQEVIQLFALPQEKIFILPNGVDASILYTSDEHLQDNKRTRRPTDEDDTADDVRTTAAKQHPSQVVLFIGRLVREKGVHVLLEAAPAIRSAIPDVRFVIVGKGPMMPDLVEQATRLGVMDCVTFTGYADDETRNHWLRNASVAVFPSLYEPFGIVALEAMAAGTPVVVSDVGGLSDIVQHEHNGLKVYPDNTASIETQVCRVLNDRSFAEQLCRTATSELQRYDWKSIASDTMKVYQNCLPVKPAELHVPLFM